MNQKYIPNKSALNETLTQMKQAGVVHPRARINMKAADGLRTEVAIGDLDFKQFLQGGDLEKRIVDDAIDYLKSEGVIAKSATYPKRKFDELRRIVKTEFEGSWTSFSPQMERLLFALTAIKKPKTMYEFGCFWGNTLAWFCGPALVGALRSNVSIGACDIDEEAIVLAKRNFAKAFPKSNALIECRDAFNVIDGIAAPLDFIYIEAKAPGQMAIYREIVENAYGKLAPGAWVIAHDTERYTMFKDLAGYLEFVRDKSLFSKSIAFDIDMYGLELSIKQA